MATIPITRPYFSEKARKNIREDIDQVLASGQLMAGPFTEKFEASYATFVGVKHSAAVNTCTTALQICLQYFDVTGRDVLVPSGSFVTDISAVRWSGGNPRLVDMNPETLSFDLDDLARKVTPNTKGMIWVHLTGIVSSEYKEIISFARDNSLFVIEDASHAHGATIDGRQAGSLSDAGCFSFFPTKILTTGTGGMITTSDAELDKYARQVRLFGRDEGTGEVVREGNDWFMDEIRACIGYHQLSELPAHLAHRRAIAERYTNALRNQPGLSLFSIPDTCNPAYYQYAVLLKPEIDHAKLCTDLKNKHGVSAKAIYRPTHKELPFLDLDDGTLGQTEEILGRSLCLPISSAMAEQDVDRVIDALIIELRSQK